MSGTPGPSNTGKAIASLAKIPSDTTRAGTQKMKFVPTLPIRRKKENSRPRPKPPPYLASCPPTAAAAAGARGAVAVAGDAPRGGRGDAPSRPPPQEMTASGPFAMGPSQAGSSAWHGGPRVTATPTAPHGLADAAALGANLTKTTAPTLKKERAERRAQVDEEAEAYSDPDEGVEIVDMRDVHAMDWMAPEGLKLKRAREKAKRAVGEVKKEEEGPPLAAKEKGARVLVVGIFVTAAVSGPTDAGDINLANALDLSESEEEEEMEDIIHDFSRDREDQGLRQERLYFFQFPAPFPTFVSQSPALSEPSRSDGAPASEGKRVSFSADTKPPAVMPEDVDKERPPAHVDGVIGQLEMYQSGAVKMRLANDILLDVTAATQPSFLQQAVHVDRESKDLRVLGEISKRFVVTPDIDSLLAAMTQADDAATATKFDIDGLFSMDTT
ncbi:RNA polymerase III RPC4-domain-containing protein [Russula earlei]|uniref:RNA polymerase III RPC4-domain-containing protein n=1 Tax=Russula earlei TaxID=71964 RepID=A0ACC0UJ75_9AGAM|nr:RNA polymerase III RPC4-domain-containing protein [Russula earlei]